MWTMEWHSFLGPLGSGAKFSKHGSPSENGMCLRGTSKTLFTHTFVVDSSPIQVIEVTLVSAHLCNDPQRPSDHRAGELIIPSNRSFPIMNIITLVFSELA